MTQKGRSTRKKENSLEKGEPFLVQTSMNDLIKDESQSSINNNNDKRIESSVDLSDIKETHKNETKELNCEENKRLDNNLELKDVEDNIIDVKIENEEQETENKELLKEVFDIEKQDSSGNEKLNKEELTEKESEESIALQKKKLDEVEQSVSKQKKQKGKTYKFNLFYYKFSHCWCSFSVSTYARRICSFDRVKTKRLGTSYKFNYLWWGYAH